MSTTPRPSALLEAQARLEHAGGYDWRDRAAAVVRGLGFTDNDLDRPLRTFSGGELTRASLARALASQPDILLLDEPTNHLDIESLEWLEEMLKTIDAGVILVAHDRWFLEAVTTAVLELERGKSVYFPGAWHVWRREQAARNLHQAKSDYSLARHCVCNFYKPRHIGPINVADRPILALPIGTGRIHGWPHDLEQSGIHFFPRP